jgi:hypothetical protein
VKTCCVCRKEKQPADFYRDKSRSDGFSGACKPCLNARGAAWRAANPDKVAAKTKRDSARKRNRDPEYMRVQRAKYNRSDKGRAAFRRYQQTEKGKARIRRSEQRNRWPRWLMAQYGLTVEAYAWLLYEQDFACPICAKTFSKEVISAKNQSDKVRPAVDHCHVTGDVRGIVCGWCNYNLLGPMEKVGMVGVRKAIGYLERAASSNEAAA